MYANAQKYIYIVPKKQERTPLGVGKHALPTIIHIGLQKDPSTSVLNWKLDEMQ